MDRGSEPTSRLLDKIVDYEEAVVSKHLPRILLFCFPNERREACARRAIYSLRLTIATSTLNKHLADPLRANWQPLGWERRFPLPTLWTPEEHR